jgi:hypothetical protein
MLFKAIDENILVTLVIKIDQTCVHLVQIGGERTWETKRKKNSCLGDYRQKTNYSCNIIFN